MSTTASVIKALPRFVEADRDVGETLVLPPLANAPVSYEIAVTKSGCDEDTALTLNVRATDEGIGICHTFCIPSFRPRNYELLLKALSNTLGTSPPHNQRTNASVLDDLPFECLLTDPLHPDIIYGYGDPAVLRVEGHDINESGPRFYMVSTSNDAPNAFPIVTSKDLSHWEFRDFIFPRSHGPSWMREGKFGDAWAPEIFKVGDRYGCCFVGRHHDGDLCIGMAQSTSPTGPFIPAPEPLKRWGVIDPHVFTDDNGKAYLYWKADNNGIWPGLLLDFLHERPELIGKIFQTDADVRSAAFCTTLWPWTRTQPVMERFASLIDSVVCDFTGVESRLAAILTGEKSERAQSAIRLILETMKTPFFVQEINPLSFEVIGEPRKVLENDAAWEAHVIEGMFVTKKESYYTMVYSGNDFSNDSYGMGVARSRSPFGPFEKMPEKFLSSTRSWKGPGHPSIVKGLDDRDRLIFHAYADKAPAGYGQWRNALSIPISFNNGFAFTY